jgi:hypothetical protein
MTTETQSTSVATLNDASRALWLATLSLMTAFMQTQAPAHRYLMARRIARNFESLREQDCFSPDCRRRFARLGQRWHGTAERLRPGTEPSRWGTLLHRLGLR